MDKKEALRNIIYNLKEIEGTRIRLSSSETIDMELALLNQQVINLYRHLQNYQSGLYASSPSSAEVKNIPKQVAEEKVNPLKQETPPAPAIETKEPVSH